MLKEVCEEFRSMGIKMDANPRTQKLSYSLAKKASGKWFKSTKLELHTPLSEEGLDLALMPEFSKLALSLDELDADFKKQGGRIFITETFVYQIKKGCEIPMLIEGIDADKKGPYHLVIEELLSYNHERDRFRIEETYLITKSPKGEWSASTNHINLSGKKIVFDLKKMPHLKSLTIKISKADSSFEANGGRIFITQERVYRIKNQIETDFKF